MTEARALPDGSWPVMLTPFDEDRRIDWPAVDRLVDWYVDAGSAGLFTVSRSSEMYHLSSDERVRLARHVVERVDDRIGVVATGSTGNSHEADVEGVLAVAGTGVDAVVLITAHLAPLGATDDEVRDRLDALVGATAEVPLGFYECPEPWKRVLTADLYGHAARTGRFVFHKDCTHDLERIAEKSRAADGTPLKLYNAQTSSIVAGIRAGAAGHSGIGSNYFPGLVAWLCAHAHDDDPRLDLVGHLVTIAEGLGGTAYPSSAKQFVQHIVGLDLRPISRMTPSRGLDAHGFGPLAALAALATELDLHHLTPEPGAAVEKVSA